MPDREVVLFSAGDGEREQLIARSVEEAVREWADERLDEELPDTVTVYGYARMQVPLDPACLLERVLEHLDEEHGGEDETEPTDGMKAAAQVFVDAVMKEYTPWACEQVTTQEVRVSPYVDREQHLGGKV